MDESTNEMQKLLREIAEHLSVNSKMDARNAVAKLHRIAALAPTLALTIQCR